MKLETKHITAITLPLLAIAVLSLGFGNVYAHTMDVAGDYKVEIGWDQEPPIQGLENAIQVVVSPATELDKKQAEEMRAAMGMGSMDMGSMDDQMGMESTGAYDQEIIPILIQFDSQKISSASAISQISEIVKMQTPNDDFDKEVKSVIDDVHSGKMANDDAVYLLIEMYGTVLPEETGNQMGNDMGHDMTMNNSEMTHEEDHDEEGGIPGLEDSLKITVTLDGISKTIPLMATAVDGIYNGMFTPQSAGFSVVHIFGMIHDTNVDLTMHPEEVESLSILPPLKQISLGIDPSDVQCKEGLKLFMRTHEESAICASEELGQRLMEFGIVDFY